MKRKLIISDSGPIFSLAIIDNLNLLNLLFDEIKIPEAVWNEIKSIKNNKLYNITFTFFKDKVIPVKGLNDVSIIFDYGEAESIVLYKELQADFLLIDDKKARIIPESMSVTCIGTIGLLIICKERSLIPALKPIFEDLLANKRYYSIELLNNILINNKEDVINYHRY